VTDALNSLLEKYEMLIVAHSGVFRVIRYYASGTPYGDRWERGADVDLAGENRRRVADRPAFRPHGNWGACSAGFHYTTCSVPFDAKRVWPKWQSLDVT
jgi:hypothetical protein